MISFRPDGVVWWWALVSSPILGASWALLVRLYGRMSWRRGIQHVLNDMTRHIAKAEAERAAKHFEEGGE